MISNMKSLATDLLPHDEALNVSVHTCSFPKDCRQDSFVLPSMRRSAD